MKISTCVEKYLHNITTNLGYADNTVRMYSKNLSLFIDKMDLRDKYMVDMTKEVVSEYKEYLQSKELSYKTINTRLIPIRNLLAYHEEYVTHTPQDMALICRTSQVKLLKNRKDSHVLDIPAQEIIDTFITRTSDVRSDALVALLASTGLRISEAQSLNWDFVDSCKDGELCKLTIIGKGSKPRIVFISPECMNVIREYRSSRTFNEGNYPLQFDTLPLFSKPNTPLERLTTRSLQQIVSDRLDSFKSNGLIARDVDISAHTFRHAFATNLLNKGVELRHVQVFLGHASIVTTQRYTHVVDSKLEEIYKDVYNG